MVSFVSISYLVLVDFSSWLAGLSMSSTSLKISRSGRLASAETYRDICVSLLPYDDMSPEEECKLDRPFITRHHEIALS